MKLQAAVRLGIGEHEELERERKDANIIVQLNLGDIRKYDEQAFEINLISIK